MSAKISFPPPTVLSMVLADYIHRDLATGKYSILGTYTVMHAPQFPCRVSALHLYVVLIETHGRVLLRLTITDMDEELPQIAVLDGELQSHDPNQFLEIKFQMNDVVFPRPGHYLLRLCAGSEVLREFRLQMAQLKVPASPQG